MMVQWATDVAHYFFEVGMIIDINQVSRQFDRCNTYIVKKYNGKLKYPKHLIQLAEVWHEDQGITIGRDQGRFVSLEFASEEDFLLWAVRWA
jgi:hypothetical protein